jgi:hypothetical protein
MTDPTVRRYDIPADGTWYNATLAGPPIHVVATYGKVALYVLDTGTPAPPTHLAVFTDEQPIDCPAHDLTHIGSAAIQMSDMFAFFPGKVLHLFQRPAADVAPAAGE